MTRGFKYFLASLAMVLSSIPALSQKSLEFEDFNDFALSHKSVKGFTRLFQDDEDFLMEVHDTLIGRRIMLSSITTSSPVPSVPTGQELSDNPVFEIGKTDSHVILYACTAPPSDRSRTKAIAYAFPFMERSGHSVIVDVSELFDPSEESVMDMTGLTVGEGAIWNTWYESGKSLIQGMKAFPRSVAVAREVTFELSLADRNSGLPMDDEEFSFETMTSLTLLPKSELPQREADPRVGVRSIEYEVFPSEGGSRSVRIASRWNLSEGRKIMVEIDPTIPSDWAKAISDGILEWNKAFRKIGLGDVLQTRISDGRVPEDPLVSSVLVGDDSDMALAARVLTDKTTSEILSCHIVIPTNYLNGIRKATAFTVSDIDPRFRGYHIDKDAILDVIRSQVSGIFCHCLGLQRNYAASYAYTPKMLAEPEMIKTLGVSASITDDELFNLYAKEGDQIIQTCLGAYDYYAIEWLYRQFPEGTDEKAELSRMVKSHEYDPQYYFCPSQVTKTDPRSLQGDQGNDPLTGYAKAMEHLKGAFKDLSWIQDDSIPDEFFSNWVEWAWSRMTTLTGNLSYLVGGFQSSSPRNTYSKEVPVPKAVQKEAVKTIFAAFRDVSWISDQKDLLHKAGANNDFGAYANSYMFSASRLNSRLEVLCLSDSMGLSDAYSPSEFLQDIQNEMLLNASRGKLPLGEENGISAYLGWLIGSSPVTKQNFKKSSGQSKFAIADKEDISIASEVPLTVKQTVPALCYDSLLKARTALKKGASLAADKTTRGKINYLVSIIDGAIDSK